MRKAHRAILIVCMTLVVVLGLAIVGTLIVDFTMRYVFNAPLVAAIDLVVMMFFWFSMLALPLAVNGGWLVPDHVPHPRMRVALLVQAGLLAPFVYGGFLTTWQDIQFEVTHGWGHFTPPKALLDASLPIGGSLTIAVILMRVLAKRKEPTRL